MKYEEAVKWVEAEVYKNGVFSMKRGESMVDTDQTRVYKAYPNGEVEGFTVSSQHCSAGNFLQLIMEMKRIADESKKYNKDYDAGYEDGIKDLMDLLEAAKKMTKELGITAEAAINKLKGVIK